ncbi:MAG: hypothetical protein ABFC14_02745 [Methanobacterium aggregans]
MSRFLVMEIICIIGSIELKGACYIDGITLLIMELNTFPDHFHNGNDKIVKEISLSQNSEKAIRMY